MFTRFAFKPFIINISFVDDLHAVERMGAITFNDDPRIKIVVII